MMASAACVLIPCAKKRAKRRFWVRPLLQDLQRDEEHKGLEINPFIALSSISSCTRG